MISINPQPAKYAPVPLLAPGHSFGSVTDKIGAVVLSGRQPLSWVIVVSIGFMLMGMLGMAITWLLLKGTGIWGVNIPIGWGFAIINFVWWIGIGHAGTLISAILLLLHQAWRTSINRFAEAMTLFAVACAGLYPLLHRPTGCSPIRTACRSGRSSEARSSGTCSLSRRTSRYRCCSGMSA